MLSSFRHLHFLVKAATKSDKQKLYKEQDIIWASLDLWIKAWYDHEDIACIAILSLLVTFNINSISIK